MSLTVTHLNADTTFLLTFQPTTSPPTPSSTSSTPASPNPQPPTPFSILLDPWLVGSSKIYHPKFAISRHRIEPCVSSLRDIPAPDLVVISQAKPDHCHEETLRQLPGGGAPDSCPLILAAPAAAKRIRRWRHFHPSRVQPMRPYEPPRRRASTRRDNDDPLHRIVLPPLAPGGCPGEVAIAFIPERRDVTGLHTAVGITYRPPTSSGGSMALFPTSPCSFPSVSSASSSYVMTPATARPVSVLYSPHGVSWAHLEPYAASHLVAETALPLTLLLHPLDRVQSPWWLGGTVSRGLPAGLAVARRLMARCWVAAHDEDKVVGGLSTIPLRTSKYAPDEARALLRAEAEVAKGFVTDVVVLDPGGELFLGAS